MKTKRDHNHYIYDQLVSPELEEIGLGRYALRIAATIEIVAGIPILAMNPIPRGIQRRKDTIVAMPINKTVHSACSLMLFRAMLKVMRQLAPHMQRLAQKEMPTKSSNGRPPLHKRGFSISGLEKFQESMDKVYSWNTCLLRIEVGI